MPPPKISIVTPSFNQAQFLEDNIRSVLDQDYPSFEHIVVDGESSDGTLTILRRYGHLLWTSEKDRGQAHALNKGFRTATGEIIGWLNADDLYAAGAFHTVSKHFADPSTSIIYGKGFEIDGSGSFLREIVPRGISAEEFIRYWRWKYDYAQPSFFFRRTVFEKVGFLDESLRFTLDHEFFIRLLLNYNARYVPTVLSSYRLHPESKTGSTLQRAIPPSIWELQRVSMRFWGTPGHLRFYRYVASFIGAIFLSFFKNILLMPGSKTRKMFGASRGR